MRYRRRDACHPIVLVSMGGLSYIASSQLWFGPNSEVVSIMPGWSQTLFSALLLLSALTCIASAFVGSPPHSPKWRDTRPLGARIERAGMIGLAAALLYYSFDLPSALPGRWAGSMALIFTATAIGAIIRAGLVWRMIRHEETW